MNIIVGSHVWVEDSDIAWLDGQVLKINGQKVEIQASNGKTVGGYISLISSNVSLYFLLFVSLIIIKVEKSEYIFREKRRE